MLSRSRLAYGRPALSRASAVAAAFAIGAATRLPITRAFAQDPPPPPPPPPEAGDTPATPTTPTTPDSTTPAPPPRSTGTGGSAQPAGGRYLLLPDISLIGKFLGHTSNDNRDGDRDKLKLDSGELSIQSYVYPEVKADAFITFEDGNSASIEEAYLTVQNVGLGNLPISAQVGRRKVPFGRVNQLHDHSWLYAVQPYALQNLVAPESLTGDGGYISYLLPIKSFFSQLDLGFWSVNETPDPVDTQQDLSTQLLTAPGAAFSDRFLTARLWNAFDAFKGTLELGGSAARGDGNPYNTPFLQNPDLESQLTAVRPMTTLSGLDLTYRRAQTGSSRLLLRSEYIRHYQEDSGQGYKRGTDGYYIFGEQRFGQYNALGARYDDSGYPFADGRIRAVSLIGTHQLTEQTYMRLQGIHGDRPGKKGFNEIWFEWVWGVGPHTHNLE